jgi:hypothetical protein
LALLWKDADPDIPVLKEAKAELREAAIAPFLALSVAIDLPHYPT